jgi:hypothetical protein
MPQNVTNELLDRVLAATGKPVLATAERSLAVMATSTAANSTAPAHLIRYNPTFQRAADYLICFQCGFLLRQNDVPRGERREVRPTWHGRKEVEKLLRGHGRQRGNATVPKEMRDHVRDQMYDGLIRQLRSVPVGLRIDEWLSTDFPAIVPQQRDMIDRQLRENLGALSPEIRRIAPTKVFAANVGMNAAFAAYWSDKWQDPTTVTPYEAAGFSNLGQELLAIWRDVAREPAHDYELIEGWGKHLGLSGWFEVGIE